MKNYARKLNLLSLLEKKSHFLLGPRSTGKSQLALKDLGEKATFIDLLRNRTFSELSKNPEELSAMIEASGKSWVCIDEIQRLPALLNEVHHLIETKAYRFLLTGSSARKLKTSNTNLLAGRAWRRELFPLTSNELGADFDLERYLNFGGLPAIYTSEYPEEELDAYTNLYLKEEIQLEALTRNINTFSKFLSLAAYSNTELLNFSKVASDVEVSSPTIREYYRILEDTLVGFLLEPWQKTTKRKAISTSKFHFFDVGVANYLAGYKPLDELSELWRKAFEHFIIQEIRAAISYLDSKHKLSFWRSVDGKEVDLIIGDLIAVEIKSSKKVKEKHLEGLNTLLPEKPKMQGYLVSRDSLEKKKGRISCLHYQHFLQLLWAGKILKPFAMSS